MFFVLDYALGRFLALLPLSIVCVSCLGTYLLLKHSFFLFGRIFLVLMISFAILTACLITGFEAEVDELFLCTMMAPVLLFSPEERKYQLFLTILSAGLYVLVPVLLEQIQPLSPVSPELLPIFRGLVRTTLIGVLLIEVLAFVFLNNLYINQAKQGRVRLAQSARLASLGAMSGGIAHEINNPLAIILGRAEQLSRSNSLNPSDLERVNTIKRMVERMAKIVRGLRQVSRDGNLEPKVPTRVEMILEDALTLCRSRLENNKIHLFQTEASNKGTVSLSIECRPSQISQILINLINNAADAVQGLEDPWVAIQLLADEHQVAIRIVNSGPLIPKELVERIGQPFFTTKGTGLGTGLGLSISASLAQSNGGELEYLEDESNTTFEVRFPRALDPSNEASSSEIPEIHNEKKVS